MVFQRRRKDCQKKYEVLDVTLLDEYARWLVDYRNSSPATVRNHVRYLTLFLASMAADSARAGLSTLSHDQIETFFLDFSSTRGVDSRKYMQAVLRVFFSFCFLKGYTKNDLSVAVPTIRSYRLAKVPETISEEDIKRILMHIDLSRPDGMRDYAMIKMFHEYGVRSKQVRLLRLSDIDWNRSEIRFMAMKHSKGVCLPLTLTVGESLLNYLQHGRPSSSNPYVFLSTAPPYNPFSISSGICRIVARHAVRAGITDKKVSPNIFRHSFATRMLQEGQSLKAIADMLGHKYLQTTFTYTKVDFQSLSKVPLPWPEVTT